MDWITFIAIFICVAVGWTIGYGLGFKSGWIVGAATLLANHPLINVKMEHVDGDIYRFYYVLDDSFIIQGTIDDCSRKVLGEVKEGDPRKIIFAEF